MFTLMEQATRDRSQFFKFLLNQSLLVLFGIIFFKQLIRNFTVQNFFSEFHRWHLQKQAAITGADDGERRW